MKIKTTKWQVGEFGVTVCGGPPLDGGDVVTLSSTRDRIIEEFHSADMTKIGPGEDYEAADESPDAIDELRHQIVEATWAAFGENSLPSFEFCTGYKRGRVKMKTPVWCARLKSVGLGEQVVFGVTPMKAMLNLQGVVLSVLSWLPEKTRDAADALRRRREAAF